MHWRGRWLNNYWVKEEHQNFLSFNTSLNKFYAEKPCKVVIVRHQINYDNTFQQKKKRRAGTQFGFSQFQNVCPVSTNIQAWRYQVIYWKTVHRWEKWVILWNNGCCFKFKWRPVLNLTGWNVTVVTHSQESPFSLFFFCVKLQRKKKKTQTMEFLLGG